VYDAGDVVEGAVISPRGPLPVTGDEMVSAMDEVGIAAAILVSSWSVYRYDPRYIVAARDRHPDRFALVAPVDFTDPDSPALVADWVREPGSVGIRLLMLGGSGPDVDDPILSRVLDVAARHNTVTNLACHGNLDRAAELAKRYPENQLVVDHLGLRQPHLPGERFDYVEELPKLVSLARHENVAVKLTGACTLSVEGYPFDDIWQLLEIVFNAFGLERCMWGTDWTRATRLVGLRDSVDAFRLTNRLSQVDRQALMGGTLSKIYGWPATT
jgi:L-fuconolactonase